MSPDTLRIATWNAGHRKDSWDVLRCLDADVVLAQELPAPPPEERERTVDRPYAEGSKRPWAPRSGSATAPSAP